MAVRNMEKAARASGGKFNGPRRKVFKGDPGVAPVSHNPDVTSERGQRRVTNGASKAKAPGELLVGKAKRPHVDTKGVPGNKLKGQHGTSEQYVRFKPLTKAEKRK
jgi:hypothetical protein